MVFKIISRFFSSVNNVNGCYLKRFEQYYPLSNLTKVFHTKTSLTNLTKTDPSVWSLLFNDHELTEITVHIPVNILNKMLLKE